MLDNNTPVYQPFGIPTQLDPSGWQWEFAGLAGPLPTAPYYSVQDRAVNYNYFGGPKMDVSAEMTYPPKRLT